MVAPRASCAASAPTKQSPAPVVSTALTGRPGNDQRRAVDQRQHAAAPSVTQMIFSRPPSDRAASMKRAGSSLSRKFVFGEKAEFAFVENEDIDEVEQLGVEFHRRAPD